MWQAFRLTVSRPVACFKCHQRKTLMSIKKVFCKWCTHTVCLPQLQKRQQTNNIYHQQQLQWQHQQQTIINMRFIPKKYLSLKRNVNLKFCCHCCYCLLNLCIFKFYCCLKCCLKLHFYGFNLQHWYSSFFCLNCWHFCWLITHVNQRFQPYNDMLSILCVNPQKN